MSLLRTTRRDAERFYFDYARNVPRGRSAVTESTRDPFHPLSSTTTCTAGDNGPQPGWISIPQRPRQQVIQAEALNRQQVIPPPPPTLSPHASEVYR